MLRKDLSDDIRITTDSLYELLQKQDDLLNKMDETVDFDRSGNAYEANTSTENLLCKESMLSIRDKLEQEISEYKNKNQSTKPQITERQLKALSKKHLLMMILDLQEELDRLKEENEKMLIAYKAGIAQERRTD